MCISLDVTIILCFASPSLFIDQYDDIREEGMNAITLLPKLEVLVLQKFSSISGTSYTKLRGLQKLNCSHTGLQEEQIFTIIENSPKLRYLNIIPYNYGLKKLLCVIKIISARRCNDVALEVVFASTEFKNKLSSYVIHNGEMY